MLEYRLSDDCKVALVQARFEALGLGTPVIGAGHLVLGVLKSLNAGDLARLLPDPATFGALCRALGGEPEPAPVNPADIEYGAPARQAIAGGMRLAAARDAAAEMTPLHLLLGVLQPVDPESGAPVAPTDASARLSRGGVTPAGLLALLDDPRR